MILTHNLDRLYEQLQEAERNGWLHNKDLLKELEVLRSDSAITKQINDLYTQKRLPPVTGPMPSNCASCGKPLP